MKRKEFIQKLALGTVIAPALVQPSCKSDSASAGAPNIQSQKKYLWKMVTTWPPNFPVVGEGALFFAQWVKEMSAGQLEIQVYGGGELVPALEVFDAVSGGTAEIGSGASYYWAGKNAATQFFSSVPFGLNAQQMSAWLYSGGGLQLWKTLYANYNLIPFPGGSTGVQMGGWFNKEIRSIDDFKGLKMRIPGLGGKVIEKAGGTAVLSAGSEIYTNLERGVIDASEWIGPYHDYKMGFHKIAKYCYYPGWHEPGSMLEIMVNKSALEALPNHLQVILETAASRLNIWTISEFEAKNSEYLKKMVEEESVDFRPFPEDVLVALKAFTDEVLAEITASDPFCLQVYDSFRQFKADAKNWSKVTEKAYYDWLQ